MERSTMSRQAGLDELRAQVRALEGGGVDFGRTVAAWGHRWMPACLGAACPTGRCTRWAVLPRPAPWPHSPAASWRAAAR